MTPFHCGQFIAVYCGLAESPVLCHRSTIATVVNAMEWWRRPW